MVKYSLIILAAGTGTRMHLGYNKMLYKFSGESLVNVTLQKFLQFSEFSQIIVVINQDDEEQLKQELLVDSRIKMVYGGSTRQESVANAVRICHGEYVFVHDGARCNISTSLIARSLEQVTAGSSVGYALGVPVKDSISVVTDKQVTSVLNRDCLYMMQTPQIVKCTVLQQVHVQAQQAGFLATDEAGLLIKYGYEVQLIEGEYSNLKITTKEDLGAINE